MTGNSPAPKKHSMSIHAAWRKPAPVSRLSSMANAQRDVKAGNSVPLVLRRLSRAMATNAKVGTPNVKNTRDANWRTAGIY